MKTYNIKTFSPSRVLLGVAILPIAILGSIFLGAELNSLFLSAISLLIYLCFWYYFAVSYLEINFNETELRFKWQKKHIFNRKTIETIKVVDIKEIVVEKEMYLRKIKCKDSALKLSTSKLSGRDSPKFYSALIDLSFKHNIKVTTPWQEFFENKTNRVIYKTFNILIVILGVIALALLLLK